MNQVGKYLLLYNLKNIYFPCNSGVILYTIVIERQTFLPLSQPPAGASLDSGAFRGRNNKGTQWHLIDLFFLRNIRQLNTWALLKAIIFVALVKCAIRKWERMKVSMTLNVLSN